MTDAESEDGIKTIPMRGVRGMIAEKMLKSLQTSAQLSHHAETDATGLQAAKARFAAEGTNVSVEDLILEIVTKILARHPDLNGAVMDENIHLFTPIHLSIAMALPGNLLVAPAIFNAQDKSLEELRAARKDLSARAKTNKLTIEEMTGGTFTVSNLGLSRVHYFTPILNAPQIAILGIGCTDEKAVPGPDGGVVFKPYIGLSLTFDHRAVDGAPAAQFLTDLCAEIEAMA
tara:strand:+ start:142137 stop:142829 length:693 start_codon:yes stop_codon:yes gene_type:complete